MSQNTVAEQSQISIIGLGNVLLGDDAFGPLVVEKFRCEYAYDPAVEVLDLGTPGLDLAPYLHGKKLVVIVDAVHSDSKPGTLNLYGESGVLDQQATLNLTAHDPGVGQCLAQLKLAGHAPSEVLVLGVVPECCDLGGGISDSVLAALAPAVKRITSLLNEHGFPCSRRVRQRRPNLWWQALPDRVGLQGYKGKASFRSNV